MRSYLLSIAVCTLLATDSWATSYNYHPSSSLYLGSGLDPTHPDQAYRNCLDNDGSSKVSGTGTMNTYFSVNLVKTRKDLFEQLQISSSISARGFFWSAGASASYFNEHRFHSDSMTWMIKGSSDYGQFVLNNPRLKNFAQELLNSGNNEQFTRTCGLEFVQQEQRAVLIAAVFTIDNVSQEQKKKLEAQFHGSLNLPFLGGNLKAQYARFFEEAARTSRISLTIYAVGGGGISTLSSLITKLDNLEHIQAAIQTYMAGMTEQQAVPIQYFTGSMSAFGWRGPTPVDIYRRDRTIGELFHRYTDTENAYKRLESIIDNRNTTLYETLSDNAFEEYRSQYNAYASYMTTLLEAADICHDNFAECRAPANSVPRIKWPIDAVDACEKIRLQALGRGIIDLEDLQHLRRTKSAPLLNHNGGLDGFSHCSAP